MRLFVCSIASVLACACVHAADAPPATSGVFGAWKFDPALSKGSAADEAAAAPASGTRPSDANHSHGAGGRHGGGGGGMGGGGGGGGMGGGGMGGGGMGGGGHGGGGRHGDNHGTSAASANAAPSEGDAEQRERGLVRLFAPQMTITAVKQQIRFDDGVHAVELGRDGMNLSGPGVGGTVALTSASPELVVDTLTDSGYALHERYQLAADGKHLELHASLKRPGADQAREIVRVFDRVDAPANQDAASVPPPTQ
jgi:hypothetical protein